MIAKTAMIGGVVALVALAVGGMTADARAQFEQPDLFDVNVVVDSGFVTNTSDQRAVVYSTVVQTPAAAWMRLAFDEAILGATAPGGEPTVIRVTSLLDGAVQHLNAEQVDQWGHRTAYFNGSAVLVELVADAGAAKSRIRSTTAIVGPLAPAPPEESICFTTDDRQLSTDPRVGRIMPIACTAWLIDDMNSCLLSAGHCVANVDTMQFNVPLSTSGGQIQHPGPEDQYPIDPTSMQSIDNGVGNDWAYFGCFPNTETGLGAAEAQGDFFVLAASAPPVSGQTIRITGYGTTVAPILPSWNKAQKTHTGPFTDSQPLAIRYQVDTTGGNSGSPVIDETTGLAIGIHTHAGCGPGGGENQGTAIQHAHLQSALANPLGVCAVAPSIDFSFPIGLPRSIDPNGGTMFLVQINSLAGGLYQEGTGMLHFSVGEGGFAEAPFQPQFGNVYQAIFPPVACDSMVQFYVSGQTLASETVTSPSAAPGSTYSAPVDCKVPFGDVNGDSLVNFADILAVIGAWGPCPAPPAACAADLDVDGTVGFADILLVIGNWTS